MKTILFHLILTITLCSGLFLETFAQDQLFPMSINRKDKTAFGLVQADNQAVGTVTWHTGKNNFNFPGSSLKFSATVNESFTLVELMIVNAKIPVTFSLLTPPEGYTNPDLTQFYTVEFTDLSGKVITGVLAFCWAENSTSIPAINNLPYWSEKS
ncbi:MAG: hypothetical protein IPM47_08150 [Sphingobacteriales bacterium]|nr:MAG: hypothetical protein IPM47_08150 [Sphingobacteriales bacterium]